jgi:integrase
VRYYTVAFGTGARTSELIALQWPNVDFQRKLVHIRQRFVNGRFTTLKADGGSRDIDMLPSVEEALRQQIEETKGQGRYMCSNVDGGPLHRDNMRNRVWNDAIRRAGLRIPKPLSDAAHLRLVNARAGRRSSVGGTDVRSRHDEDALYAVWEVHSTPDAAGRDTVRRGITASEGEKCKPSLGKRCARELERDTGLEPAPFALARRLRHCH